jgi:hypothetical protein
MGALAAIRPDEWNFPLFVHVLGAMVLVGALVTAIALFVLARRGDGALLTRLGFRTLLFAGVPGFLAMRIAAEWVKSEEDVPDDAGWIEIGYMTSDAGVLFLIIALVLAGFAARREGRGGMRAVALGLAVVMLVAYGVALWAMTAKPA